MQGLHIPEERGIAGKLAAALYLTGAATGLLLPFMPGVPVDDTAVLVAVAAAGGVWGILALTVVPWETAPPIVSYLSSFAGLPITAVVMAETGGATSPARFYLFFIVFYCCYFYLRREAAFFVLGAMVVHALPVLYESNVADSGFLSELLVILPTYAVLGGLIAVSKSLTVRLREESRVLSLTDDLTGVSNRRAFEAALDSLVAGQRVGDGTGLLLMDLDDFKEANTMFGHTGGDRVLCAAADALRDAARGNDMVARLGGDEFAILAHGVTESGMRRLATVCSPSFGARTARWAWTASRSAPAPGGPSTRVRPRTRPSCSSGRTSPWRRRRSAGRAAGSRRPPPTRFHRSADLAQPPGLDLVDEAPDRLLVWDERARPDRLDRMAEAALDVLECSGVPVGARPAALLEPPLELLVGEGEHPAVGVVDEHDLLGAEHVLRDRQ